jgi:hypothetical protein
LTFLFKPAALLCSPFAGSLEFALDEGFDAVIACQAQADECTLAIQVDVKIKKGQHLLSATTQSANSATDTTDGLN